MSDTDILAAKLAEAERRIAALQVEVAVANERAESYRLLVNAKDEIIKAARDQTKEWRKNAAEVLAFAAKASSGGGGGAAAASGKSSSSSSSSKKK